MYLERTTYLLAYQFFATILPFLLLTGEELTIQRGITPYLSFLRPPEKLALQVTTTGRYEYIQWMRNSVILNGESGLNPPGSAYADFGEIYYTLSSTTEDLGIYEASLQPAPGQEEVDSIVFVVVEPGKLR